MPEMRFDELTKRYIWMGCAAIVILCVGMWVGAGIQQAIDQPARSQQEVLLLDLSHMSDEIDNQYDRVLDDVTDHDRYVELRRLIDQCFEMVNDYNDIRGTHWPYMPSEYCDRVFP